MNRTSIVALVIGAMLFGCGVGMVAHEVMEPESAEAFEGQKWENKVNQPPYIKITYFENDKTDWLDKQGQHGWELIHMEDKERHYFKRPLN